MARADRSAVQAQMSCPMEMVRRCSIVCAALAAIAFAGCGTVNTVQRAQPVGQPHVVNDKRIITNPTLNDYVSIVGVNESVDSGGLTKVQVDVVDTENGPA